MVIARPASLVACMAGKSAEGTNGPGRTPTDIQRFLAIFQSRLQLGISGGERFEYWRRLLWTMMRRPWHLSLAITLTIDGHYFRRICELYMLREERRHYEPTIQTH